MTDAGSVKKAIANVAVATGDHPPMTRNDGLSWRICADGHVRTKATRPVYPAMVRITKDQYLPVILGYMDPGAGNMLLQVLAGGAAGVLVLARLLWRRLGRKFRRGP